MHLLFVLFPALENRVKRCCQTKILEVAPSILRGSDRVVCLWKLRLLSLMLSIRINFGNILLLLCVLTKPRNRPGAFLPLSPDCYSYPLAGVLCLR